MATTGEKTYNAVCNKTKCFKEAATKEELDKVVDGTTTVAKATNATKVNNLEIKQDTNGVLKIGDIIIPQKQLLWSGNLELINDSNVVVKDNTESFKNYEFHFKVVSSAGGNRYFDIHTPLISLGVLDSENHYSMVNPEIKIPISNVSSTASIGIYNSGDKLRISLKDLGTLSGVELKIYLTKIYEVIE